MLVLNPTNMLSDRTSQLLNWCDIYNSIIRWQKWFMETGQIIAVTGQIHTNIAIHATIGAAQSL